MADEPSSSDSQRALDASCRECGEALSYNPWETRPLRCEACFETYLREIDSEFLASYGELGVTTRRTVAETCLRGLVLEMPPQRKVLAMAIVEQFLLASADLIGLTHAIRERHREPIVRSFLAFRLDGATSQSFFAELLEAADEELLDAFGCRRRSRSRCATQRSSRRTRASCRRRCRRSCATCDRRASGARRRCC